MMNATELEKRFTDMVTQNQQIIYKVCYFYTSDDYTIDELYQQTVINMWKAFPNFRNRSKESTWIYRIAVNTCVSYFRRSSSHKTIVPLAIHNATEIADDDDHDNRLQELYRMIGELGKLERALILLWLDDKSYQEIAEILGISKDNVGVKLSRIKEKLKKMSNN